MCNQSGVSFAQASLQEEEVRGKTVLEVGSCDFNGSVRNVVSLWQPLKYVGVDLCPGPGVDEVCDVGDLVRRFGAGSMDLVVSTELLEHVAKWRVAVSNLKRVLKPGGTLLITTRSLGFGYHGYPFDFWRFEVEDMRVVFCDLHIEILEKDPVCPGVFLKARKPTAFAEKDLSGYNLFSIVRGRRCSEVRPWDLHLFKAWRGVRLSLGRILPDSLKAFIKKSILRETAG